MRRSTYFLPGTYDAALGFMACNVLVADDDAAMQQLVASVLQPVGTVTCADDGDELLQAVSEGIFDLVVTDISMPWMTGLHVAHSMRTAGLEVPVIVMTALPISALEIQPLGPRTVLLRKPFRICELVDAANRLLAAN
jgi:CheY-like chemotaxis protein